MSEEHDPFNEPEVTHPRARELMKEDFFWDCVNEDAPFGSDEGWQAYYEFRRWRETNIKENLVKCLSWICDGNLEGYNEMLCSDAVINRDLAHPESAFLADHYDVFTLDATVIATALAQLMNEGRIDNEAKRYVQVAITRQVHPQMVTSDERREILLAVKRVLDAA